MCIKNLFVPILLLSLLTAVLSFTGAAGLVESGPQPYMVKNINERNDSSDPDCRIALEEVMLCLVDDGIHGRELWRSDGTAPGTSLIKDIFPGEKSSEAEELTRAADGRSAYFTAQDNLHGRELWITDGTAEGTMIVKEIYAGPKSSYSSTHTLVGDELFFLHYHSDCPSNCVELWKTDGTAAGTVMVKDLTPPPEAAESGNYLNPGSFAAMGDKLYFANDDGVHGKELWRSDGTEAGTFMVKDISPVYTWEHHVADLVVNGDLLFFTVDDNVHGRELWKSDGTEAGTVLVKDIEIGPDPSTPENLITMNGTLYFETKTGSEPGLWRSNGSQTGTTLVKALGLRHPAATNTLLFFYDIPPHPEPFSLWRSDGTSAGTFKLESFPVYDDSYYSYCSGNLFAAEDRIYACAADDKGGELWTSDGSETGTHLVEDIVDGPESSNPRATVLFKNRVYFQATRRPEGRELWKTDSTKAGTSLVADLNTEDDRSSSPGSFGPVVNNKGQVIFIAEDTHAGTEPMLSDGTLAGTEVFIDLNPGYRGSSNHYSSPPVALANGRILFIANDGTASSLDGNEVWSSNNMGGDLSKLSSTCGGIDMVATENAAFFRAEVRDGNTCIGEYGLWKSDGTSTGTEKIAGYYNLEKLSASKSHVFFYQGDYELWAVGEGNSTAVFLADYAFTNAVSEDEIYFYRHKAGEDTWLWKSDGTVTGTVQIKKSEWIDRIFPAGDRAYFLENEAAGKRGLWVTDGSAGGTALVKGGLSSQAGPTELAAVGDSAFFALMTEEDNGELWLTNGTAAGTKKVKSFVSGPYSLTEWKGMLYFSADDGTYGQELWSSAGTTVSTKIVADIDPRPGEGGSPYNLAARDNLLYFSADDGQHGTELWALNLDVSPPTADFSASPLRGAPPLLVQFQNLSTGDFDTCVWDFGDDKSKTTCDDTPHKYRQEGRYTVSLTVSGPVGEDTMAKEQYIVVENFRVFMPNVVKP